MFCQNCGSQITGKFCPNCGAQASADAAPVQSSQSFVSSEEIVLWQGQPASITGKLKTAVKVNPDTYIITNQRIIIKHGIIGKKEDEIELSRIKDYKVTQSLGERIQKIGDLVITSTDPSTPVFMLKNVTDPENVKEMIRSAVLEYKKAMGVVQRDLF